MTALLCVGCALLLIGGAFYWLNTNSPVQTPIPAIAVPLGIVVLVFAAGMLASCSTLPRYPKVVEADGYLVECGKPYTRAEDRAGIDHDCNYYGAKGRRYE